MDHARTREGGVAVLLALFVLAFSARAAVGMLLLREGGSQFVLASDDGDAYDAAARWQAFATPIDFTPRMQAKWAPQTAVMDRWPQGYWLFLAAHYAVFGSAYASTIVLQAFVGALGVLAGYALARAVLSETGALLAGVALALSSTGVFLAAVLYAESLYIPLVLGGLALVARSLTGRGSGRAFWICPALAGVAFGLAEAIRPLALPICGLIVAWCLWPSASSSSGERARRALGLAVGFAVGVAPFVAHDLAVLGRVTTFTVGGAEAFADLHSGTGMSLPGRLLVLFGTGGWAPLGEPLISQLGNLASVARLSQAVLGALGMAWLVRRGYPGAAVGRLIVGAALAIAIPPLLLGLPLVRYRAPADPLIIVAMVVALEAAWRYRPRVRRARATPGRSSLAAR